MVLSTPRKTFTAKRIALGFAAVFVVVSLGYNYAAWNAGRAELRELCRANFGPKVYKKVSASGYFDSTETCEGDASGCWRMITYSPFQYVEFQQLKRTKAPTVLEDGYYRLSRAKRDSPECSELAQRSLDTMWVYRDYSASGMCIRVESISTPTAAYGLFAERLPTIDLNNLFRSRIGVRRQFIKNLHDGELVAEFQHYSLFQNSVPRFSSFATTLHCESRGIVEGETDVGTGLQYVSRYITPE